MTFVLRGRMITNICVGRQKYSSISVPTICESTLKNVSSSPTIASLQNFTQMTETLCQAASKTSPLWLAKHYPRNCHLLPGTTPCILLDLLRRNDPCRSLYTSTFVPNFSSTMSCRFAGNYCNESLKCRYEYTLRWFCSSSSSSATGCRALRR